MKNLIGVNLLMENSTHFVNSTSSDELLSSNLSTEDLQEKNNRIRKKSCNKNGIIDKKIFFKFQKLTRTLKETRTNLLNMDQMLVKFREQAKLPDSLNFTGTRPRGRRTASVPPPLRISNCHLCGGDNSHQPRCQSVDNFESANLIKVDKSPQISSRHSQSMQDLRILPPSPLCMSKETPSFATNSKMEESTGDALNSARGSEISLASATVEEMRSDIINLKNQLQKLELTGQIQTQHSLLYQQVEMKDRVITDMTQHLQELSNKLEMSEEQRCQLLLKLEDTLRTSLDVGSEAEKFAAEVKRVEEMAAEVQADKDRLRRRARKIVLELKEKCKQYLSETQRLKDREWELEQKSTLTSQENSALARQITGLQDRLQESHAELQNFKMKSDEIQQLSQRKDMEMSELKALYQEVQKTVQNHKDVNHKLVNNNEALKNKVEILQNEKNHLDMKLVAMEKELILSLQRLEELKMEVKGLRASNTDYQAQLLSESNLRQAVERAGQEMAEKVNSLDNQLSSLQNKYLDAINEHSKVSESLRQEAAASRQEEEQRHQEALKSLQLHYENLLTAIKVELSDNQTKIQSLQNMLSKEQEAKAALKKELAEYGQDQAKLKQLVKCYHVKRKKLQEKNHKVKIMQDNFLELHEMFKAMDDDFKEILYLIYIDVEATVSMLASGSITPPPPSTIDMKQPKQFLSRDWLSGIKSQLRWIQDEVGRGAPAASTTKHHTVSVDSVHTHVPLQSPKVNLKMTSPRKHSPPIYLIEKSERGLQGSIDGNSIAANNDESRSNGGPLNSTEIPDSQKSNWENTQTEIFKRYQRFQQIFDNINADFSKSNIRFEAEQNEATKMVPASGGLLSSSLSSISEFSCDAAVEEITSDMVNNVLKNPDPPVGTSPVNSPSVL